MMRGIIQKAFLGAAALLMMLTILGAGGDGVVTTSDKTDFVRGLSPWRTYIHDLQDEIIGAKESYSSLLAKLNAIQGGSVAASQWQESGQTPTFVDSDTFTVSTDLTAKFEAGRRVQAELVTTNFVYSYVVSSSFASNITTVNLRDTNLTSSLSKVYYALLDTGTDFSVPVSPFQNLTSCSLATLEGEICWDTDDDTINFGTGSGIKTPAFISNNLSVFAATTSAQLAGVLTNETGTLLSVFSDKPVFTTDITSPIVYGGSAVGSTLTLAGTSNGAPVNAHIILNGTGQGNVGIGTTGPNGLLDLQSSAAATTLRLTLTDNTNVAHGITTQVPTGVYGDIGKLDSTGGGLRLRGFSDAAGSEGVSLDGVIGVADPTDTVSAVLIRGLRKDGGTSVTTLADAETVLQIRNGGSTNLVTVLGSGNVGIGTTTLPGSGTPGLVFGQGTAFGTMGSNTAGIQAKDVAGTAEMFAVDEAGVATQISPHPSDVLARVPVGPGPLAFPWAYTSENPYLGKRIDVQLAMFVADYEKRFGVSFTTISDLPPSAKKDWRTEKTKTAQETYEKQIQTEMQKESEVIDIALVWETVEVLEEIDDPANPRVFFVVNPETRTIQEKREPGKKSIGTGKFIYQLKPNHHVDAATGKVFRKKTQAEAEAAISQVVVKAPPKWLSDRGVTF